MRRYQLPGHEELIPEQGLERVEVDAGIAQLRHAIPHSFHVLMVHAVLYQQELGRQLQTSHLDAEDGRERDLYDLIALHLQRAAG